MDEIQRYLLWTDETYLIIFVFSDFNDLMFLFIDM